jgi:hypothetical protein
MLGFSLRGTDKLEAPLPPGFSCTVLLFSKSFFLILCHILLPPWFYSNHHAISLPRLIIHKFREGSIDGLTLVFSHPLGKWSPISEISELKEIINILAEDEEKAASSSYLIPEQMVFVEDEEADELTKKKEFESYCEKMAAKVKAREGS